MQVAFYLAGEITQVIDSIPWVRCASGNVFRGIGGRLMVVESDSYEGGTPDLSTTLEAAQTLAGNNDDR